MGLRNWFKKKEKRSALTDPDSWLVKSTGGYLTTSGTQVNERTALGISAVYSCVRIISWTIASLPLHTYKRLEPRGKEKAYNNNLYKLLHDSPNPEQTAFEFKASMSVNQLLRGAGIAEIERDRAGRPVALWPIPTPFVTPRRTPREKLLIYEVNAGSTIYKSGQKIDGESQWLWPEDVIVFPAFGSTRDIWLSPIGVHRETLGYTQALKDFGAKTFGQGVNPAGIVSVDSPLSETAEESLIERLKGYSGMSTEHRLMYLNAGVKFERIGLEPVDAQFLENERFSNAEIARIFNVPLFLINETEKSTSWGSGIEEINHAFVSYTLSPYLTQWEQEFTKKLFDERNYFPEFCVEGLLRGRLLDRYKAYQIGRQHTFLSPDDIRELENMNPLPDKQGERYDTPLNMANVDLIDDIQEKDSEPAPAADSGSKDQKPSSQQQKKPKKPSGGQGD